MADQNTVVIELPPVWTMEMWDVYCDGQARYDLAAREAKIATNGAHRWLAGSLALVQNRYVRVTGPTVVTQWLDGRPVNTIPLAIASYLNTGIGGVIDAAMSVPLPDFLKGLLGTTATQPDTPVLAP